MFLLVLPFCVGVCIGKSSYRWHVNVQEHSCIDIYLYIPRIHMRKAIPPYYEIIWNNSHLLKTISILFTWNVFPLYVYGSSMLQWRLLSLPVYEYAELVRWPLCSESRGYDAKEVALLWCYFQPNIAINKLEALFARRRSWQNHSGIALFNIWRFPQTIDCRSKQIQRSSY